MADNEEAKSNCGDTDHLLPGSHSPSFERGTPHASRKFSRRAEMSPYIIMVIVLQVIIIFVLGLLGVLSWGKGTSTTTIELKGLSQGVTSKGSARTGNSLVPPCGFTPQDAKASDCIFDIMRYAWTPPECYNETLARRAREENYWQFYEDRAGNFPIPESELQDQTYVYTHFGYHLRHCLYVLEIANASLNTLQSAPSDVDNYLHIAHCAALVIDNAHPPDILGTSVGVFFSHCVYLDPTPPKNSGLE